LLLLYLLVILVGMADGKLEVLRDLKAGITLRVIRADVGVFLTYSEVRQLVRALQRAIPMGCRDDVDMEVVE